MLGDDVELSVVVRDLDGAAERLTGLLGLKVHRRGASKECGFKNVIGHIELLQPTDQTRRRGASPPSTAKACTTQERRCVAR